MQPRLGGKILPNLRMPETDGVVDADDCGHWVKGNDSVDALGGPGHTDEEIAVHVEVWAKDCEPSRSSSDEAIKAEEV